MSTVISNSGKATQKYIHIAPRKVRLVADLVRGADVDKALAQLSFVNKKAAEIVAKVIKSAAANLRDKNDSSEENSELRVSAINVDGGAMIKRIQPAPQGRAHVIRRRTSHVTVTVSPKNEILEIEE